MNTATQTAPTAEERREMISAHLRAAFAPAPLPENSDAIAALIEAIQQLESTGDLAALTQVSMMVSGSIQRVACQPR